MVQSLFNAQIVQAIQENIQETIRQELRAAGVLESGLKGDGSRRKSLQGSLIASVSSERIYKMLLTQLSSLLLKTELD